MEKSKILKSLQQAVEILLQENNYKNKEVWSDSKNRLALEKVVDEIWPTEYKNIHNLDDAFIMGEYREITEDLLSDISENLTANRRWLGAEKSSNFTLFTGQETDQEQHYRGIVNTFIERELITRPDVIAFRESLNNGKPLTEVEAEHVLSNELAGIITFEDCKKQGLCPIDLRGKILAYSSFQDAGPAPSHNFGTWTGWWRESFQFDLSVFDKTNKEVAFTVAHRPSAYRCLAQRKHIGLTYVHSEQNRVLDEVVPVQEDDATIFKPRYTVSGYENPIVGRALSGYENSIVGRALDIAAAISYNLQIEALDALFWLLTGRMPERGSINGVRWQLLTMKTGYSHLSHGPVEILVQPWTHEKTLEAFFGKVLLPGRKLLPTLSSLDLFRRIRAVTPEGKEPAWEEFTRTASFAEWQAAYSSQMHQRGSVRTTYKRVENHLKRWLLWLRPRPAFPDRCPKCWEEISAKITKKKPCPHCGSRLSLAATDHTEWCDCKGCKERRSLNKSQD